VIDFLKGFNKMLENRIRLGIMSLLAVNDSMDFSALKEQLNITDGNLSSHLSSLEQQKFIDVNKQFVGKKPNTSYKITREGRNAFVKHIDALEKLINRSQ